MRAPAVARARRHAAQLERLISPEGTFPAIGRSIAYRFGALSSSRRWRSAASCPTGSPPPRCAPRSPRSFAGRSRPPGPSTAQGWLRIGFCGHQPGIGERYISTGSVYLCAVGLLPLGLPASDPFWTAPAQPWTAQRAWSGQAFPIDSALYES